MLDISTGTTEVVEGRVAHVPDAPIRFDAYLEFASDRDVELVEGVVVERMAAQLDHEKLFMWLSTVLNNHVSLRDLGLVLGSRTPVEINAYGGRLPDLLFVRKDRLDIVRQKAIYGPPDLVVEIVSPNDRPSEMIALEAEYRTLGVEEIWFIDLPGGRVRLVRAAATGHESEEMTDGEITSPALPGLRLSVSYLLREPRPNPLSLLPTGEG